MPGLSSTRSILPPNAARADRASQHMVWWEMSQMDFSDWMMHGMWAHGRVAWGMMAVLISSGVHAPPHTAHG